MLARHPAWGVIALPLLARLYVHKKELGTIAPEYQPAFATKRDQAVGLVRWAVTRPPSRPERANDRIPMPGV
jgi:hypothetical protein